ncbi:B12-binding domain-containing radical SAM protein [Acetobacterium wieringae]|uniref:B12-binding domain-containing radical SAM protein n=1 Tax=Acetobacterium wieringae TaxID=52694 RepID=UPI002B20157D|nr:radical SAM protein [Acetobacterium wieringae]MEA4807424.1 radical SAM protein [Acetobacterium wieringae]
MKTINLKLMLIHRGTRTHSITQIEPIGHMSLAEMMASKGIEVAVFSGELLKGLEFLAATGSDGNTVVGLYCDYENQSAVESFSREIKRRYSATVLVGGPQTVGLGEDFLRASQADAIMRGEGEYSLFEAIHALQNETIEKWESIPGLCSLRSDGSYYDNGIYPAIENLDALPIITGTIKSAQHQGINHMAVMSGRGCPFHCSFCYEGGNSKNVRRRSVANVMQEIRCRLKQNPNVKYIFFGDDTFTLDKERVRSFCEQLKELRKEHDFVWFADAHVNIVIKYPEIVKMMVDAGLVRMQIGIESCNQHIIDIYNKKIKREGLFEVIEICQAAGLPQLVGNIIIGGALETRESLDYTFDTVNQMIKAGRGMVEVVSTFYMPFPETAMSKNPQAFGIYVKDEGALTSVGDFPVIETATLSIEEICAARNEFFEMNTRLMRKMLSDGEIPDEVILKSYALSEKYGLSGMWQGLAYSRYPYFDAQYKARIRGDKLTKDYDEETVFATHPQRIALLSLTPELAAEIPVLNGFVYSPFEFEVLKYSSGKVSMLEMAEILFPAYQHSFENFEAFKEHLLQTIKKLEQVGMCVLSGALTAQATDQQWQVRETTGENIVKNKFILFKLSTIGMEIAGFSRNGAFLGIYGLASYLDANGYNAIVCECRPDQTIDYLKRYPFHEICGIGFSVDFENKHVVRKVSAAITETYRIPVLIGGPEAISLDEDYLRQSQATAIVRGEGELAMVAVLEAIKAQQSLDKIPGIFYLNESGQAIDMGEGPVVENLDELPFPAYDKSITPIDFSSLYLMSSRGCPYHCVFCHEGALKRPMRQRSVDNVIAEMKYFLQKYPELSYFKFCDDTLVTNPQWLDAFCREAKALQAIRPFQFYCEADVVSLSRRPEVLKAMVDAGLNRLQIGIETVDKEMLKVYRKNISPEMVETVVKAAYDAGVQQVFGALLVGGPFENREHIEKNKAFGAKLLRLGPGMMEIAPSIVMPYPMTDIGLHPEKYGLTIYDRQGLSSISDYPLMDSETMDRREIMGAYQEYLQSFVDEVKIMLNDGELTHEDILRCYQTSLAANGPKYWINIISHHKPTLTAYYTMLAREAASRIVDVDRQELPHWRPQRLIEMWRDVDFSQGYPLLWGEALSPFEYEIMKYATGKSTIATMTELLYERFGKPFGEGQDELMERIIETLKVFDKKYWLLVVPF